MSETDEIANQPPSPVEDFDDENGLQLTRLNSVLNGLRRGALGMRARVQQVMNAVRLGSYKVDSLQVSRRIVSETMAR
jgi:hypothetical protein